jgi:hypothetical protein
MRDEVAKTNRASGKDKDFDTATNLLSYDPSLWYTGKKGDFGIQSFTAASSYGDAAKALESFNDRYASGDANFDPRANNLREVLIRFSSSLGDVTDTLSRQMNRGGDTPGALDGTNDDVFYHSKGVVYAYNMVLRELGRDAAEELADHNATEMYNEMLKALDEAVSIRPAVVTNAKVDASLLNNHLAPESAAISRANIIAQNIMDTLKQ